MSEQTRLHTRITGHFADARDQFVRAIDEAERLLSGERDDETLISERYASSLYPGPGSKPSRERLDTVPMSEAKRKQLDAQIERACLDERIRVHRLDQQIERAIADRRFD